MSMHDNFTKDEWKILADTPVVVGKAMISTSASGLVGSTQEVKALSNSIKDLAKQKPASPLLQALTPELERKVNTPQELGNVIVDEIKSIIKKPANTDTQTVAIEACNNACTILDKSSESDSTAYKQFVMTMAQKVAEAAHEGGPGSVGNVSANEQKLMNNLKSALKI